MATRVIVGLGNPGKEYQETRHNVGFMVVDALAEEFAIEMKPSDHFEALIGKKVVGETTLHLVKPTTYMNLSGRAVRKYVQYFKLDVADIIVVYDDVDFPFGELRLKAQGGTGGHNGLKSLESELGTKSYARLRVGISAPVGMKSMTSHVLGRFAADEKERLNELISEAKNGLKELFEADITRVMNKFNVGKENEPKQQKPL